MCAIPKVQIPFPKPVVFYGNLTYFSLLFLKFGGISSKKSGVPLHFRKAGSCLPLPLLVVNNLTPLPFPAEVKDFYMRAGIL